MHPLRRQQSTLFDAFCERLIEEHGSAFPNVLSSIDQLLEDGELLEIVQQALAHRAPRSRTRGRSGTPAEVVIRILILKHMMDWTYCETEREVATNFLYRRFTRIGMGKVPDEKTLIRLARAIGAETIKDIHDRIVRKGVQAGVASGKKMRVDTTVTETNIHYPTDSTLLRDGARVITRLVNRMASILGDAALKMRNRMRSVNRKVLEIAHSARVTTARGAEQRKESYHKLLAIIGRVVGEATRRIRQMGNGVGTNPVGLINKAKHFVMLTRRVMDQAKARVFDGDTHHPEKLVSVFEPQTEIIRKGKSSKPTEFGKVVKVQEAENQLVTDYEVFEDKPADHRLLIPSIERHATIFGRAPTVVTADAGFFSAEVEAEAKQKGVKKVAIPAKGRKSEKRRKLQRERWFRRAQKWRTGCEGRISVLKHRHGLRRCRNRGFEGMKIYVGLGVIADNLITIVAALG